MRSFPALGVSVRTGREATLMKGWVCAPRGLRPELGRGLPEPTQQSGGVVEGGLGSQPADPVDTVPFTSRAVVVKFTSFVPHLVVVLGRGMGETCSIC